MQSLLEPVILFVRDDLAKPMIGKKYERYALDSLGEEEIDTPAGRFRTLHLRAMTDSVTEIWLALDHHRLPVKIRFTDKKGDVFEQIATELGSP